jgi:hypothetical protein
MAEESNQKHSTATAAPAMKHETLIRQHLMASKRKFATSSKPASNSRTPSIDDS